MRVPLSWLRRVRAARRCRSTSSRRGCRSPPRRSRASRRAASPMPTATSGCFRVGRVLEAVKHPNADRLQLTKVDVGEGDAALDRLRRLELRRRRNGRGRVAGRRASERRHARAAQGARRGLGRDDPGRGRGRPRLRPRRDHAAPRRDRARDAARGRAAARTSDHAASSRRATVPISSRSTGSPARSRRCTTCRWRPSPDPGPIELPAAPVEIQIDDLGGCPRYIGRLFEHVDDRPVAGLAEGAAARRRHAPDLERRRRHELRDARARQPAARVRLHDAPRRPHRRPPRARRASGSARWTASTASSCRPT